MSFISEHQIKNTNGVNLAPMIDFLFLMLMFFACLALSKSHLNLTNIELAEAKSNTESSLEDSNVENKIININITKNGEYFWSTEIKDYLMSSPEDIAKELNLQYENGILPENRLKTQVLVKIDKQATWDPILKLIFAVRNSGFEIYPIYLPENDSK